MTPDKTYRITIERGPMASDIAQTLITLSILLGFAIAADRLANGSILINVALFATSIVAVVLAVITLRPILKPGAQFECIMTPEQLKAYVDAGCPDTWNCDEGREAQQ